MKKFDSKALILYAVTDRGWTGRQTLAQQTECALKGGATCIQLREKDLNETDFLREALEIKELCREYEVPFIINDSVNTAKACGADGVHVGQSDMNAAEVRRLIGPDMILGVSAVTVRQALDAEAAGADYLGVGAVFPTPTKADAASVSLEELRLICGAVKIPVVAIGGINRDNMERLSGTGIAGSAIISAIFGAEDIEEECRLLFKLSKKTVGG